MEQTIRNKDTAEAHHTTDADWQHENWEDDAGDYPEEEDHEECNFADDLDHLTFDDSEEEYPHELLDAAAKEEEAYINCLDPRKKMRDTSNVRGSARV